MSGTDESDENPPGDEALPEEFEENPEDEFLPEDFEDDPTDDRPRTAIKRVGRGGQMIGAAMIGLAEILQPKPKAEIPIAVSYTHLTLPTILRV